MNPVTVLLNSSSLSENPPNPDDADPTNANASAIPVSDNPPNTVESNDASPVLLNSIPRSESPGTEPLSARYPAILRSAALNAPIAGSPDSNPAPGPCSCDSLVRTA